MEVRLSPVGGSKAGNFSLVRVENKAIMKKSALSIYTTEGTNNNTNNNKNYDNKLLIKGCPVLPCIICIVIAYIIINNNNNNNNHRNKSSVDKNINSSRTT